ncbi:uncharacterized protein [Embiotoca jacksoni]|uniref:uncharacterized protein n=1 Tax=Embiotoca jacksoni TaxID=100190 RepID=UPI003703B8F9
MRVVRGPDVHKWDLQNLSSRCGGESNPITTIFRHDIPDLKPTIAELISLSQRTIIVSLTPSALSTSWMAWNSFCFFYTTFNLQFPSFDVASVCSFISCAHSTLHIKIPTTKVYLSGINFFSKLLTGSPSTLSQLALLIKGLQHQTPPPTPRLLPLTTDLISRCIVTLRSNHFSTHRACTLQSMFLLTFYGFLRCSEFASSSAKFNPSLHPCIFNLYPISEDCVACLLKQSKTNQISNPVLIFDFKLNSHLSLYEPLIHYLLLRKMQQTSSHEPLFITETGHVANPSWFLSHFREVLITSGINPDSFSGHSFSVGAATTASSRGVPDHLIKVMGCWSSQAFQLYTRHSFNDLR